MSYRKSYQPIFQETVDNYKKLKEEKDVDLDYFNNVVVRYLKELKTHIKSAKSTMEKNFYQTRYDVQLKDFSKALNMSEKDIENAL